jgi:hypothetical protein
MVKISWLEGNGRGLFLNAIISGLSPDRLSAKVVSPALRTPPQLL